MLHNDYSKPAIFLSGGIGVTLFRGMIKYAIDRQLPIKITMFDSNRNLQNILYKYEFDKWASQNQKFKIVYTLTEEEKGRNQDRTPHISSSAIETKENGNGEHGRIDRKMIERHVSKEEISNAIFYICGPPGMLKAMQQLLEKELQIPKGRIKLEEFSGY